MKRLVITSLKNPLIIKYLKLLQKKHRYQTQQFIIYSPNAIAIAKAKQVVVDFLTTNSQKEGILVTTTILKQFLNANIYVDQIAICNIKTIESNRQKVLVLDNLQDSGNVGTLIRTAVAFGYDTVVIEGADPFSLKSLSASQGAIFQIEIIIADSYQFLKTFNGEIIATQVNEKNSLPYYQYKSSNIKKALVLGNEGNGVKQSILEIASVCLYVPSVFESLNVAQAGAILLNYLK